MSLYKKLPNNTKSILQFNEWVMWSSRCNSEMIDSQYDFGDKYYHDYKNLRHWCVDVICEKGLSYNDIPSVNHKNQNEIFKQSRKSLDLKKFKNVRTHAFQIIESNGKISPEFA